MDVSKNNGTPKSSALIGFSFINHPFCGTTIFGNTHMYLLSKLFLSTRYSSATTDPKLLPPTLGLSYCLQPILVPEMSHPKKPGVPYFPLSHPGWLMTGSLQIFDEIIPI